MFRHPICLIIFLVHLVSITSVAQMPNTLYVSVNGTKSGPIKELKKENFRVFENEIEQTIQSITFGGEAMSVGFVFDVSPSVTESGVKVEVDHAALGMYELAKHLGTGHEYFVLGFSRQNTVTADWTNDANEVAAGLKRLRELRELQNNRKDGKFTRLTEVVTEAIGKIKTGKHAKRVLLLFTDGLDSGLGKGSDELMRLASAETILFFPILFAGEPGAARSPAYISPFLEEISALTGGRSFYYTALRRRIVVSENTAKVDGIRDDTFARLFELLNSQYKVQYTSSVNASSKKRKPKVDVVLSPEMRKGKGEIYILHRRFPVS